MCPLAKLLWRIQSCNVVCQNNVWDSYWFFLNEWFGFVEFAVDLCQLPSDPGPCKWFTELFYFNATLGTCQKFSWGGCGGNRNRFVTMAKCLESCASGSKLLARLPANRLPGQSGNLFTTLIIQPVCLVIFGLYCVLHRVRPLSKPQSKNML